MPAPIRASLARCILIHVGIVLRVAQATHTHTLHLLSEPPAALTVRQDDQAFPFGRESQERHLPALITAIVPDG